MSGGSGRWPALPLADWQDTYETLHMYTQIIGKVRLALAPMMNHWWQVPLYVTARGLTTSPIPYGALTFQGDFDLIDHQFVLSTSAGAVRRLPLGPPVKEFYRQVMQALADLGIQVAIWTMPVEVADPIPFEQDDRHATCDPVWTRRFFEVLRRADAVLKAFRADFTGKCSPVHFFWGSFDLAVTRFSGRPASPRPGADPITALAYDAELSSVGFWPGGGWPGGNRLDGAAFYAYAYPEPPAFSAQPVRPAQAAYHPGFREYLLMYDDVRTAAAPEQRILDFAQSTYEACARLQGWPIDALALPGPIRPAA